MLAPKNLNNRTLSLKLFWSMLLLSVTSFSQHHSKLVAEYNEEKKTITVMQELTFFNQTNDTLSAIVLNDWNNAYSSKNTPLARRFSDEFERGFHLAKGEERGNTSNITILNETNMFLTWERDENYPDVIQVRLRNKLLPNEKRVLKLTYIVKLPSNQFTKYGYGENGKFNVKEWYLTPSRYENHGFVKQNNVDLDDDANALSDFDVVIKTPSNLFLSTDLDEISVTENHNQKTYQLSGKKRLNFSLYLDEKGEFLSFKNSNIEVITNLKDTRLNDIQRAIVIDKIVNYVTENLGQYPHKKITLSQADYEKNPFYGLNQLPNFISPFPDEFIYEIKFLKTYLNNYLHSTLQLNKRNENWIYDGIQVYLMMKYIEEFHPDSKMMGNVSKLKLLRGYNLVSLDFNGQYSYFYMLMARKNLDQPLGNPKNTLIKFNEKIASKYRAGLSLKYLDSYLNHTIVPESIKEFYERNKKQQTSESDFENILKLKSGKKLDWFFDKIINSRDIIDYKFNSISKTKDSVSFTIKNKTETNVPIPVYGIKDKEIVFKHWIDSVTKDSVYTFPRNNAEKIVINYENIVPEFNLRNNWQSLRGFRLNNRPIKFNFFKDLEDPFYNQIIYVPTLEYNLYDGFQPGMRFHNKTILDKPFIFDLNPTFSTKTKNISGKGAFYVNQYNRDSKLYNIRYIMGGHYLHYAPDAYYTKLNPTVSMRFRPANLRDNRKESIQIKEIIVNREKSAFITDENTESYQVFNAKYYNGKTEVTNHFNFLGDVQVSKTFGKLSAEMQYRRLFDNNRQVNLRFFAGTFVYNNTISNYFDFGLDRPSDYLFESDYLGRSETKGLFSQQIIVMDGFFKSKLDTRFANQWMTTTNASTNIWNWIEVYGDLGVIKNKNTDAKFVYDSGVRLNLVTDYFELYFPVYSSNGWEIGQQNYGERIRFIVTFNPETLISLFTRKWF
ncbi:gluzincin family metallopeptidase [Flavobacterium capsici]|uniref:Aminopeptidase n=1 Tax=Flavobacterium capsici TaxID=3075618 RepID=A0AA96F3G5_9FLAO|nr:MULTISPECIES: aminopeptidase [unclassified Flavobacterium]WNM17857.1 aminopeptidase [Flavobacterium sp. PMR2A8]WNM21910.1 aminopeptidase [Flavobacterium sp. PMTSA4]